MHVPQVLSVGLSTLLLLNGVVALPQGNGNNNGNNNNGNNNNGQNNANGNGQGLTLDANNVQSASASNGNPSDGQAASATDDANFINFCSGKQLDNGQQLTGGACEATTMGNLPSKNNMVSTVITNPKPGDDLQANTPFNVQLQVANLKAGVFTNPDTTYYSAPQDLQGGNIVGHVHVTIQDLGGQPGDLAPSNPPDASTFAFFKGIDDDGNGNGLLQAAVTNGLPAGNYRVCTMSSAANHQPVLMPVAQRGAQDDCTKFTVGAGNGGNNNNNGNNGNNGNNNNGGNGSNNNGNNGSNNNGNNSNNNNGNNSNSQTSSTSSAAASANTDTNNGNGNGNSNNNNNGAANTAGNGNGNGAQNTGGNNGNGNGAANTGNNQQATNTVAAAAATNTGNGNNQDGSNRRDGRGHRDHMGSGNRFRNGSGANM